MSTAVQGTAAFGKFMQVLQQVADAPGPMSTAELVRASGFPRPTLHRIVAALLAEGLLREADGGGAYELGPRLMELASRSWGRLGLRGAAADALRTLRDTTGETVHMAVPSGTRMVYIEKLESPSAVRMASRVGSSMPMHSTAVGKAYLAALDDPRRQALLPTLELTRHTEHTVVRPEALRRQLQRVQAQGWSVDDEENEGGITCYGAVIRNGSGEPVAAVSVSTLRYRQPADVQASYVRPLLAAVQAISARIAGMPTIDEA